HVLMSTFNGARYLEQQIDSIRAQTVATTLVVRDDGSTDATLRLLGAYSASRELALTRGRNLGITRSFFRLLRSAAQGAQYVAFSDQDDVWLPTKLQRAVDALSRLAHAPALYCSRCVITNARLEPIGLTPLWPHAPAFGNALVENVATGCTIVLN